MSLFLPFFISVKAMSYILLLGSINLSIFNFFLFMDKHIDLSKVRNQIKVANDWEKYCTKVSLPKKLENDISNIMLYYYEGLITLNERSNRILDILNAYFKK